MGAQTQQGTVPVIEIEPQEENAAPMQQGTEAEADCLATLECLLRVLDYQSTHIDCKTRSLFLGRGHEREWSRRGKPEGARIAGGLSFYHSLQGRTNKDDSSSEHACRHGEGGERRRRRSSSEPLSVGGRVGRGGAGAAAAFDAAMAQSETDIVCRTTACAR